MIIRQSVKRGIPVIGIALILGAIVFSETASEASAAASIISENAGAIQGQNERIVQIRARYAQVQERIALAVKEAEGGSPPEFYSTEIFVNKNNGSWRASGTYSKKTVFWYTDQPDFAREDPGGELSVLAKIEITEIVAARTFFKEYLFDKGKIIFAFIKNPGETGTGEELRYYFSDGAVIRSMEGQRIVETNPDTRAIEAEIKTLQALFLSTF